MDQNYLSEATQRINNALEHLKRELSNIRAGRANPSLVEEVGVNAYGSKMKLMEVGTISAPQPSLLIIQVWDPSIVKDVEKAILEANLGLTPSIDGTIVRLPIPPLTEERREEFVKITHQKGEEAKIEIRQIRQDVRETLHKQKEAGEITEDDWFRLDKNLQEMVDKSSSSIDELIKNKEEDLRQV
ncbi:ribosome recycling factor [Candidatus Daviesbacteria bacterium]|nr:ribosome recycling factor [Candidatus Daviesbacteria bacterium]